MLSLMQDDFTHRIHNDAAQLTHEFITRNSNYFYNDSMICLSNLD